MTIEELGKALAEARIARGLTLRDVERDTRINHKYLQSLEEGTLDDMPAPVYARAFMRTYAQYLGLNDRVLVQQLPGAKPEPEMPALPQMARERSVPLLSASWLVAGVVVVALLGLGMLLFWNRGGDDSATVQNPPINQQGDEQVTPPPNQTLQPPVLEPGIVPSLEGHDVLVAVNALTEADIPYLIVEVPDEAVPAGRVIEQSPPPDTPVESGTVVTLMVSR